MSEEKNQEIDVEDEKKIDELAGNIYRGLELTVTELQKSLPDVVDNLSGKQLRRALKAVISYPEICVEDAKVMTEAEQRFNAGMLALHQASVQLEIKSIGELQKEYDIKQAKAEGESNG